MPAQWLSPSLLQFKRCQSHRVYFQKVPRGGEGELLLGNNLCAVLLRNAPETLDLIEEPHKAGWHIQRESAAVSSSPKTGKLTHRQHRLGQGHVANRH